MFNGKQTTARNQPGTDCSRYLCFCRTRVLSTAVDLEIFTHISQGKKTAQELSQATGTNTRGLEMVLDTLCSMGYLYKKNGAYELTPQSRFFLVKGKKMYYGST